MDGLAMTDEQTLLAGIRDDRDDTTRRLIFADWLEEHDQTKRAEFIRLQCDLADPATPGRAQKQQRERGFLSRCGFTWLGPLQQITPPNAYLRWDFGRGFVEKLTFPARIDPQRLAVILRAAFRCAPLQRLRALPHHPRSDLTFSYSELMLNEGAIALASCPELSALRALELNDFGIDEEGFQALIDSPHLRGLTWLDLRGTPYHCHAMSDKTERALRRRFGDTLQLGHVGEEYLNLGDAYGRMFRLEDHSVFHLHYGASAGIGAAESFPSRRRRRR
jgi:uncharacterized protein (TIGR02996 family)